VTLAGMPVLAMSAAGMLAMKEQYPRLLMPTPSSPTASDCS
jgi:hypothetical protein